MIWEVGSYCMAIGIAEVREKHMNIEEVRAQIRQLIIENIPIAGKLELQDEDQLLDNGILDSLGVLDVVTVIEEKYNISLTDDELVPENFQSIAHIATFVLNKISLQVDS